MNENDGRPLASRLDFQEQRRLSRRIPPMGLPPDASAIMSAADQTSQYVDYLGWRCHTVARKVEITETARSIRFDAGGARLDLMNTGSTNI